MATENTGMDDLHLKIQSLADNELPEEEIGPVLEAIQGSYEHRNAYADLLRLKKQLSGLATDVPGDDWVVRSERSIRRKLFRGTGTVFFIASYVALLGAGIVSLLRDNNAPLYVTILVVVGGVGLLTLLGGAIADRVRESRTDKYKGVIR